MGRETRALYPRGPPGLRTATNGVHQVAIAPDFTLMPDGTRKATVINREVPWNHWDGNDGTKRGKGTPTLRIYLVTLSIVWRMDFLRTESINDNRSFTNLAILGRI